MALASSPPPFDDAPRLIGPGASQAVPMQDSIRGTFLESVPPSEIELSDCFVLFRGIAVGFPEFQLFTNFSAIFFLTGFGANLEVVLLSSL